jgi:transketolase
MSELIKKPFGKPVSMRLVYGQALIELGHSNSDVVVLSADVSNSDHSGMFEDKFPDRFFNVGIAEQALVNVAVGLANGGKIPIANTFAFLFATRAVEQIRTHLCYGKANVKLAGAYAGLSDSFDGPTHHSITDLAILRSFPNMTVVVPADPKGLSKLLPKIANIAGPVYFRLCRNEVPEIFTDSYEPEIGKGVILRSGSDVTILGCGVMVSQCIQAAEQLSKEGIEAQVVEIHTIKPLDHDLISQCARDTGAIVTAEEHSIIGGLGGAVAESLAAGKPVPLELVGINDTFAESGPYKDLMDKYGLGIPNIIAAAKKAIKRK